MNDKYGVIYCATNIINDKRYIGQTIRSVKRRTQEHKWYASNGSELPIHRAIRKYGEDNFEWSVIDTADGREELDSREIYWIEKHNTFKGDGYNASTGGQIGVSDNPDEMSIMRGGKSFLVFDLNGEFVGEFLSQQQFAKDYGLNYKCVNFVLNNKKQSTENYTMIFKKDFTEEKLQSKLEVSRNREFYVFDKENLEYKGTWNDRDECSRRIDMHRTSISRNLSTNNKNNRSKYLVYYYKNIPNELKDKVKEVI